jgi:2-polyprenyl-3-methyl-5-hydroxy-6-metoxy-1,4-benzoquinol methylase
MINNIKHNIEVTERIVSRRNDNSIKKMKKRRYNGIVDVISSCCDVNLPLLDIGARKGELLDMFADLDFGNLFAIEIWPPGLAIIEEKGHTIVKGNAENFSEDNKFGTVILSHVLEHCPHPKLVLKNVYKSLVTGGFVYVQVPRQKKGQAPHSAGHYSFFPNLNSLISIFNFNVWKIIDNSNKEKNLWVLFRRLR